MIEGDVIEAVGGVYAGDTFLVVKVEKLHRHITVRRLHRSTETMKLNVRGKFAKNFRVLDDILKARALAEELPPPPKAEEN